MQIYICIIRENDYNLIVDTMNNSTRQKILNAVQKHQVITVSEITIYLDLRPANIRHHLSILMDEGLVEGLDSRKREGRGRPETIYSVSRIFKEDGLSSLTDGILRVWGLSLTNDDLNRNIKALAHQLAGVAGEIKYTGITKRLSTNMEYLKKLRYQAHWEASPSGPRIILGNCPYWKIINQHPELCIMDKILLEKLSGLKISQISKLERDERGLLACSFIGS